MIRPRHLAAGAIGAIGALGLAVLPALPASASTGSLCSTFGSHLCIGDPGVTVAVGDQITAAHNPGRVMIFTPGPGGTGTLHFSSATGLCIAPSQNSDNVRVVLCNATGVSWTWVSAPTSHYFVNAHFGTYLSIDNTAGDIVVSLARGATGWNQQWTGPA